jgi:hypothetical protein
MERPKVVCTMPRQSIAPAAARRAAYRIQLTAALLLVCRKIRRLQTSSEAKAACDDIARELRALASSLKRGRKGEANPDVSPRCLETAVRKMRATGLARRVGSAGIGAPNE